MTGTVRRALGLLLAGSLLLAGCGGGGDDGGGGGGGSDNPDQPPDEPVTIRMGWLPTVSGTEQISLMLTRPELAENHGTWYELEITEFPGTPQILQGLATGSLDAGGLGSLTAANGLDQGADLVVTAQYIQEHPDWGETLWLVDKDSGISSLADVAGKTVATNSSGSYVDHVATAHLAEAGLEVGDDYDKVEIPFPQQQDALAAGQTDVGVFPAVFASRAMATGDFEPLFGATDVQEQLIIVLQAFRRDFIEENRVAVEKFLEDFVALTQFIAEPDNRQDVIQSFAETSQTPVEQAEGFLLTENDYYRPPDGAVDVELLQENWDFFHEQGAFESELNAQDHVMPDLRTPS